eukprot:751982-Hanusia_phi.AAC.4
MSLAFSHDGSRLASASYDRTVKVWDLQLGKLIHSFTGHTEAGAPPPPPPPPLPPPALTPPLLSCHKSRMPDRVTSVAFLPGGGEVISGSYDRTRGGGATREASWGGEGENRAAAAAAATKFSLLLVRLRISGRTVRVGGCRSEDHRVARKRRGAAGAGRARKHLI